LFWLFDEFLPSSELMDFDLKFIVDKGKGKEILLQALTGLRIPGG
jgi:hypothetical protein